MCGRFAVIRARLLAAKLLKLMPSSDIPPDFNVAPGKQVMVVLHSRKSGEAEMHPMRWGLLPPYAQDAKVGSKYINARAETVATSKVYAPAFHTRRCIIPADGFYEWHEATRKPHYFSPSADNDFFAFAGIWERWRNPVGQVVVSFSILTTAANDVVSPVHARMPLIINHETLHAWLAPAQCAEDLLPLLTPYPVEKMHSHEVSTAVNNAHNNHAELITSLAVAA